MSARGVVVMGAGRSGTSMVAGLLAAHGVAFGGCKPANEHNPRGYFENLAIPPGSAPQEWPGSFWRNLKGEGWDGASPWGAKHLTTRWGWLRQLRPSLIVLTSRPDADVLASLQRTGWGLKDPERSLCRYHRRVRGIRREALCPIVTVSTPALIGGEYGEIRRAFGLLGVPFSKKIARSWIEPTLWNRRGRP